MSWWTRSAWGLGVALVLGLEGWLLVGRRSGEVAYHPPAAVIVPSLEIAGASGLAQVFVPGADGLAAVTFVPLLPSGVLQAAVDLQLDAEGADVPMARRRLRPDEVAHHVPFTWEVPHVERSAGRRFTLRVAAPDAAPGHGLALAIGPPGYRWGDLRVGGRQQWGDLVFETRATRVHVIDMLRQWRRDAPGPLTTEAGLVSVLVLLNLAAAGVIRYLIAGAAER